VLIAYHVAYGPDANDGHNYSDVEHVICIRPLRLVHNPRERQRRIHQKGTPEPPVTGSTEGAVNQELPVPRGPKRSPARTTPAAVRVETFVTAGVRKPSQYRTRAVVAKLARYSISSLATDPETD
jgi:hypothetical protein